MLDMCWSVGLLVQLSRLASWRIYTFLENPHGQEYMAYLVRVTKYHVVSRCALWMQRPSH